MMRMIVRVIYSRREMYEGKRSMGGGGSIFIKCLFQ